MTRDILVVDDEPEKSLNLVHYLQSQGYTVRFARGGMEALSLIEAKPPDFVICDLEMPDLDGYGMMEATTTRFGDLPFILANEEWTMDNWSKQAGGRTADCHVSKPFMLQEIGAFVRRIFQSIDEEGTNRQ
jgi:CheY-like chemotaxis protein